MGDVGALALGAVLGTIAIIVRQKLSLGLWQVYLLLKQSR